MNLWGRTVLLLPFTLVAAAPVPAQQWSADVYAGGTRYDAIAARAAAANIVGNLRVEAARLFGYLSAAAPLDDDAPVWGALGGGMRVSRALRAGFRAGLELDSDGYVFRHAAGSGGGLSTHVLPHLALDRGAVALQLRGGRHDHYFDVDGASSSRHLYEMGVRGSFGSAARFAIADVRVLARGAQRFPMARVQLGSTVGAVRIHGMAGRWFGDDLGETVWGAGAAVDLGSRGELWAGVRRDAADPLYQSVARTSWNVGYSLKLGNAPAALPVPLVRSGSLVVRLPRSHASQSVSVAGEFSGWQPLPMRLDGDEWVVEVPLATGVYRFAFVAADGAWFVPEGYPGRMDDDMGGHVAVVVVE